MKPAKLCSDTQAEKKEVINKKIKKNKKIKTDKLGTPTRGGQESPGALSLCASGGGCLCGRSAYVTYSVPPRYKPNKHKMPLSVSPAYFPSLDFYKQMRQEV